MVILVAQRRPAHSLSKNLSGGQQSHGRRDKPCTIYRANSMSSPAHLLSLQLAGWHSDCKGQRNEKRKGKRTKWTGLRSPRRATPRATYVPSRQVSYTARNAYTLSSPPSLSLSFPFFLCAHVRAFTLVPRNHRNCFERHDILRHGKGRSTHGGDRGCRPGNGL